MRVNEHTEILAEIIEKNSINMKKKKIIKINNINQKDEIKNRLVIAKSCLLFLFILTT